MYNMEYIFFEIPHYFSSNWVIEPVKKLRNIFENLRFKFKITSSSSLRPYMLDNLAADEIN